MEWLRLHPYASAIGVAGVLFLFGAFIVSESGPVVPKTMQVVTWEGSGVATNPISYVPSVSGDQNSQSILQQVQSTAPYTYIAPAEQSNPVPAAQSGDSFDLNAFLKSLSGISGSASSNAPTSTSGDAGVTDAYAFIPSGFVATPSPSASRSPVQQSLYDYGNAVGSYIQAFESTHTDETAVLQAQSDDRTNAAKAAALEKLGNDLANVGTEMLAMNDVPPSIASAHQALAQSYIEIGGKLAQVPNAQGDSDFVTAIETYDTSVNLFVTHYVALAQLFGAYGVTFSQTDPGSVFSFNPAVL